MEANSPSSYSSLSSAVHEINKYLSCSSTGEMSLEFFDLDDKIRDAWEKSSTISDKEHCIELATLIPDKDFSRSLLTFFGMASYEEHEWEIAAYAFMRGAQLGDIGCKNNLAYMIRRNECSISEAYTAADLLSLLRPGLEKKEDFSIVNAALVMSILLSTEEDWETADRLFAFLPQEPSSVINWWDSLPSNDPERDLVLYWLSKKEKYTPIETDNMLFRQECELHIKNAFPNIPKWFFSSNAVDELAEPN